MLPRATLALTLALTACHREAPPPPRAPVTSHACRVSLHARPDAALNVHASASAADQAAATEQAWTAVCATLPEAHRATCRDTAHFRPSVVSASASAGGPTTYTTTITLEPVPGEDSRGSGTSTASREDACRAAVEAACRAAGATGDCLAAGTHEEASRSSSSTTM